MLIADAGIGILPDFHAAHAITSGALVRVLPEYEHRSVDVHALYPSHRSLSAKVRAFVDVLIDDLARTTHAIAEPNSATKEQRPMSDLGSPS